MMQAAPPRPPVVVEPLSRPDDLDGVLAIEEASFHNPTARDWYERELRRPDVCCLHVLRTPDVPVAGFCSFWRAADQVHINTLAVRPDLRRRGLGLALVAGIVRHAAALGAVQVTLEVRRSNEAARRLYERAGFREAGVRPSYYTSPVEDALVLRLSF